MIDFFYSWKSGVDVRLSVIVVSFHHSFMIQFPIKASVGNLILEREALNEQGRNQF